MTSTVEVDELRYAFQAPISSLLRASLNWTGIRSLRLCRNRQLQNLHNPVLNPGSTNLAHLPTEIISLIEDEYLNLEAHPGMAQWPFTQRCKCSQATKTWRKPSIRGAFITSLSQISGTEPHVSADKPDILVCQDYAISRLRRKFMHTKIWAQIAEQVEDEGWDACRTCRLLWQRKWKYLARLEAKPAGEDYESQARIDQFLDDHNLTIADVEGATLKKLAMDALPLSPVTILIGSPNLKHLGTYIVPPQPLLHILSDPSQSTLPDCASSIHHFSKRYQLLSDAKAVQMPMLACRELTRCKPFDGFPNEWRAISAILENEDIP